MAIEREHRLKTARYILRHVSEEDISHVFGGIAAFAMASGFEMVTTDKAFKQFKGPLAPVDPARQVIRNHANSLRSSERYWMASRMWWP